MTFFPAILAVPVVLALYAAAAYHRYNRALPQNRPCVDCAAPVHVNGYDLYYREAGTSAYTEKNLPPVILVHGGPGHSSLSFRDGFDFLTEEARIIFYDQRGSGNSQIKPDPGSYTIEQLVEELESLRRDTVKAERVILVGHSFGSALVQRYAIKYPQHVEKLVIVSGIRINNGMRSRFVWKWFGPALYSTVMGFPPADPAAADAWALQSAEKDNPRRLFDKSITGILEDTGTMAFAPWLRISLSITGCDYKAELRRLQTPTLFIYGTADSPHTGKPVADELCAALPNCQSVEFTRSGHWAFLEEPLQFQQVIKEFLFSQ